jgi:hypothetical protein
MFDKGLAVLQLFHRLLQQQKKQKTHKTAGQQAMVNTKSIMNPVLVNKENMHVNLTPKSV